MINIEEEYIGLLAGVLYGGKEKEDRTGTGTRSVFGRTIRHDMSLGFPLLTTKKIYFNHKGHKVMTYSMVKKTKLVPPTKRYLDIVKQGYKDCKLNIKSLKVALMPVAHLQR